MNQLIAYEVDLIKVLVIFYLLIYSAQIDTVLPNLKINNFSNNIVIKYIIIFFIFFFLVSSISDTKQLVNIDPIQKLIYSIIYFILFIFTLKINTNIRNIIFILLIISFFINMNYQHYTELLKNSGHQQYWVSWKYPSINLFPVNLNQLNFIYKLNNYLYYIIFIILVIGLIQYFKK